MCNKTLNTVQLVNFATSVGFNCQFHNQQGQANALGLIDTDFTRFAVALDSLPSEPPQEIIRGLCLHLGISLDQLTQDIAAQPRRWLTLWPGTSQNVSQSAKHQLGGTKMTTKEVVIVDAKFTNSQNFFMRHFPQGDWVECKTKGTAKEQGSTRWEVTLSDASNPSEFVQTVKHDESVTFAKWVEGR